MFWKDTTSCLITEPPVATEYVMGYGVLAVPRSIPSIRVGMNIIIFLRDVPSHHHQPFTTPPHHKHPPCDAVSRDAEDTADKRDPRAVNKIYEIHFTQTSSICD